MSESSDVGPYWFDCDGYERAVRFEHRLKQVPMSLRALVYAARLMRGGDGGRKPWRHMQVPATLGLPNGERRGRVFKTMGKSYASCTAYANELHGEIEAR